MKISMRWLGRYVDLRDKTAQEVAHDLTMSTAEVEGIEPYGVGLEELVVGEVVECGRHPNADKLSLTKVSVGNGDPLSIVCGAPNVAQGQKVAVAQVGTVLPGEFKIKKAKIRGEESFGMICSERELGLSDEHQGIMVLNPTITPGTQFTKTVPLPDSVLEIENKSINHRPDLWGHYGIARELAAIYGRELKPLLAPQELPTEGRTVPIRVDDTGDCPRFTALVVEGVEPVPSPTWLRYLLHAVGQRSIDALVDLTNFVMLDLGQPMHAFDLGFVGEDGLHVRRAAAGEALRTLDGEDHELDETDIVIAAGGKAVSLAGIKGGEGSMVNADTRALLVEVANWNPGRIRRTGTRLGVRTDASARFEKTLDPACAELAQHRYLELMREVCPNAAAAGPLVDPTEWRYEPIAIELRRARLELKLGVRLGADLDADRVRAILESLAFDVGTTADGWQVTVPSFRATKDVTIEDDLIEEVGRMFRYDNIAPKPLVSSLELPPRDPELYLSRQLLRMAVTELACHEVMNYSFVHDRVLEAVGAGGHEYSRLANPVAPESARMRRHVMPSTLASVAANLREHSEVRLIERGKGYWPERRGEQNLPHEVSELAIVWSRRDGGHPYAELRSGVATLLDRVDRRGELLDMAGAREQPWVHPGKTVAITRGDLDVGYVGALHPQVCRALDLPATTAIANLDLRALLASGSDERKFAPIPRFPSQPVDVALITPGHARVRDLAEFLQKCGKKLVRDVRLFEVYRGAGVPEGKKSLNFTVTLGADDRTLSASDEAKYLDRVRQQCGEVDAELRG